MKNLKKFVGEYAYNIIKNMAIDEDAICKALVTPQNARNVFADLTEYEVKGLCSEISSSKEIGKVRETTQEEIIKAFNKAGYGTVIFDDEEKILECKKYYREGEVICTYGDLKRRMKNYHMLVAIKIDIDKIERSKIPMRDDEYGTSILNIQIAKNGLHMSIKNRYNHTVSSPDSTLNNNLNVLYQGLQSMVLGYYGFASLNDYEPNYNNIININGIYLKYFTERNNIYFGAFVLDSEHGARYTDSSRYFVVKCDVYYYNCLILDFKKKEAINLFQKTDCREPLITRALKENILTSANKNEVDYLSAIFPNAKKELLKSNKNALKYIHEIFGYDFAKPHNITAIMGNFTAKSIAKITNRDTGILLISTPYSNDFSAYRMLKGKFVNYEHSCYEYNISEYFRKMDFEKDRKRGNTIVFVIQQEEEFIKIPKEKEKYYARYCSTPEHDKSGNDLTKTRKALKDRLYAYKREKEKNAVNNVDFSSEILKIVNSFESLRNKITNKLSTAKTYEDFCALEKITGFNLSWLFKDIERLKRQNDEKIFSSIALANEEISRIIEKLEEFHAQIV